MNVSKKMYPLVEDHNLITRKLAELNRSELTLRQQLASVTRSIFESYNPGAQTPGLVQGALYSGDSGKAEVVSSDVFDQLNSEKRGLEIRLAQLSEEMGRLRGKSADLEKRMEYVRQHPEPQEEMGFFQRSVLHAIFPATDLFSHESLGALGSRAEKKDKSFHFIQMLVKTNGVLIYGPSGLHTTSIEKEEAQNRAERISFYTDDHVRLDGCIVYANPGERDIKQKKMMIMVQGNLGSWQGGYAHAQLMAQKYGCNVLIYNARGVGASTGKMERLDEAVKDCRAAISFALANACGGDSKKLAVYGHSLGGAITAAALQEMVVDQSIPDGVGLYLNHHSFSSLSDVVKNLPSFLSVLGGMARGVIRAAGHTNLDAIKALTDTHLADHVVVASAENDEIIRGVAQIGTCLQQSMGPVANDIVYVTTQYGHHEESEYLKDHDRFIDTPISSSSSISNSSHSSSSSEESLSESSEDEYNPKDTHLEAYHRAILHWTEQ